MDSSQQFLKLYNTLDELLAEKYHGDDRNKSYIMRYSIELQKSAYLKTYERGRVLNLIRQLRNSLVHDFDMNKDGLIEITPKLLEFLQEEIDILSKPKRAIHIATKRENFLFGKLGDNIKILLKQMISKGNLQVPILDEQDDLIGVLSPNAIIRYQIEKAPLTEKTIVNDLLEFLPLEKHISEYYAFVEKNMRAEQAAELFDSYYEKGKKLAMIFVTETGKATQAILGIITPYDVVNLDD